MRTMSCRKRMAVLLAVLTGSLFLLPVNIEASGRTIREQMQAGQTGYAGGGAPPGPFGDHWVHLQNNGTVDSYDSREGPYDSDNPGMDAQVGCNVYPNDSQAGVSMDNNAFVYGDVSVTTAEADNDITLMNNAIIYGEENYDAEPWVLEDISTPSWFTVPGGDGDDDADHGTIVGDYGSKPGKYEITGNGFRAYNNAEVTFYSGEYHFDSFELSNNVEFIVDPNIGEDETVDVYVDSSIIFENNSELLPPIEVTGDTTKLRFFFEGTTTVDLSNNVEFYGFIYAPNAMIEVRNNDKIYGNLVGKEVYIWNNAGVHYDEALLNEDFGEFFTGGIPAAPHKRDDWKEIITP